MIGEELYRRMIPFAWFWATISFTGRALRRMLKGAVADAENEQKATVFGYYVNDPERYGVAEFDADGKRPQHRGKTGRHRSRITRWSDLYFYPNKVVERCQDGLNLPPAENWRSRLSTSEFLKDGELKVPPFRTWFCLAWTPARTILVVRSIYLRRGDRENGKG